MQMELAPFSHKALQCTPGIYEHYSGKRYEVIAVARHSETLEEYVVYRALYGSQDVWVRPLEMFMEMVTVNGNTVLRFTPVKK